MIERCTNAPALAEKEKAVKSNHFICPTCGHDFYDSSAYSTCDACQTFFYAASSRTCVMMGPQPKFVGEVVNGQVIIWPNRSW